MIDWENKICNDIQTNIGHTIGRSLDVDKLKKLCKYDVANDYKPKQARFRKDMIHVEIDNGDLYSDDSTISVGTTCISLRLLYSVLEEIYRDKLMVKDKSRAVKYRIGKIYVVDVLLPVNGMYPLIILDNQGGNYSYIVAPYIEDKE